MPPEFVSFPDEPDPITGNERRVRVRYAQALKTFCQRGTGDLDQVWWIGKVRNLSGRGIGFVLQHCFQPGTILTLELENSTQTFSHTLQVEVVRVLAEPGGWFFGCEFLEELTEDDVRALV
jgi:hypothetical protein